MIARGPAWLRRLDAWASWAPSGRSAVPVIVLLVLVANLIGVATVTLFQLLVDEGSGSTGRTPVLLTVGLPRARPADRHGRRAAPAADHQPLARRRARPDR